MNSELENYRRDLSDKPQILALTKADAVQDQTAVDAVRRYAAETGQSCHLISAVSGVGLEALIHEISDRLDEQSPCQ